MSQSAFAFDLCEIFTHLPQLSGELYHSAVCGEMASSKPTLEVGTFWVLMALFILIIFDWLYTVHCFLSIISVCLSSLFMLLAQYIESLAQYSVWVNYLAYRINHFFSKLTNSILCYGSLVFNDISLMNAFVLPSVLYSRSRIRITYGLRALR